MRRRRVALAAAVLAGLVLLLVARGRGPAPGAAEPGQETEGRPGAAPASHGASGERTGVELERTIAGRVIDASGEPWTDLAIACEGRATRTGPDGTFELDGVDPGMHALDLSSDFDPSQPLGERLLACAVPPVTVQLGAGAGRHNIGTHIVPRSRPFWVEATVELDPSWADQRGITLDDVRLDVRAPEPEDLGHLLQPELSPRPDGGIDWSRPPWRMELPEIPRSEHGGRFRFALETPHEPFLLRVSLRRFEPIERLVVPVPDGSFAETFRMP